MKMMAVVMEALLMVMVRMKKMVVVVKGWW